MLVVIPKITGIPSMLEKTRISGRALKSFRDTKDIKENNNIRDSNDISNRKYFVDTKYIMDNKNIKDSKFIKDTSQTYKIFSSSRTLKLSKSYTFNLLIILKL